MLQVRLRYTKKKHEAADDNSPTKVLEHAEAVSVSLRPPVAVVQGARQVGRGGGRGSRRQRRCCAADRCVSPRRHMRATIGGQLGKLVAVGERELRPVVQVFVDVEAPVVEAGDIAASDKGGGRCQGVG